jgi:hypothetical protein
MISYQFLEEPVPHLPYNLNISYIMAGKKSFRKKVTKLRKKVTKVRKTRKFRNLRGGTCDEGYMNCPRCNAPCSYIDGIGCNQCYYQ